MPRYGPARAKVYGRVNSLQVVLPKISCFYIQSTERSIRYFEVRDATEELLRCFARDGVLSLV